MLRNSLRRIARSLRTNCKKKPPLNFLELYPAEWLDVRDSSNLLAGKESESHSLEQHEDGYFSNGLAMHPYRRQRCELDTRSQAPERKSRTTGTICPCAELLVRRRRLFPEGIFNIGGVRERHSLRRRKRKSEGG